MGSNISDIVLLKLLGGALVVESRGAATYTT